MIRISYLMRRLPHLSLEEFQSYWSEKHPQAAPADAFADHFRDFSVRGFMILEGQAPEARARIEEAWREGFAPFVQDGLIRTPMPALVASGRRP